MLSFASAGGTSPEFCLVLQLVAGVGAVAWICVSWFFALRHTM